MLGVLGEPRPGDALDLGMALQRLDDQARILIVALHADVQGLQPAQHEEGIERARYRAHCVLQEGELLVQVVAAQHERPGHHVAVSVQVLGHRVRDDVDAELQRSLEIRSREGVVADGDHLALAGDVGQRGEVADLQHRIGGRLHPEQLLVRPERALHRAGVGHVDVGLLDPETLEYLVGEPEGPAVEIVAEHDVIARGEQMQDGIRSRQSAGEGEGVLAVLQPRQAALQRIARRVPRARVLEPFVLARTRLRVRRSQVYRRHHGAGGGVGVLARMDRERLEVIVRLGGHEFSYRTDTRVPSQSMRSILVTMAASRSPSLTIATWSVANSSFSRETGVRNVTTPASGFITAEIGSSSLWRPSINACSRSTSCSMAMGLLPGSTTGSWEMPCRFIRSTACFAWSVALTVYTGGRLPARRSATVPSRSVGSRKPLSFIHSSE